MKKIFLFALLNCLCVYGASAQTRTRLVDNFDLAGGIRVTPAATPAPALKINNASKTTAAVKPAKKLVQKTVQQTMAVQDGMGLKNAQPMGNSLSKLLMSSGSSLGEFTTGDDTIDSYIEDSSVRYGIDPLLIYAQMHQESSFKVKATSYKGASGLMQLMPATARRFGVTEIYNPKQNIDAGIKYMRWLIDTFDGDVNLALAGYNAGEGAVMKYGYQIPPYRETQEYVRRISGRYAAIRNPKSVKPVKKLPATEVARLEKKSSAPLTVYERNPLTVRMPDGRMRLVNQ